MSYNNASPISNELEFRAVKMGDIAYIACIYFTLGLVTSLAINNLIGDIDEKKEAEKPLLLVLIECYFYISLVAIISYIIRNVVQEIPSPFHGMAGYDHFRLKELGGGAVYGFVLYFYASNLRKKVELLVKRVTNTYSIYYQ